MAALELLWPRRGCADRYARQVAGESTFYVAHDGEEIVGRGEAHWAGPFMSEVADAIGSVPEINGLEIVAHRRGAGIGTALIAAIEEEARRRGVPAIGLGVGLDNDRAERLYRRLGYVDDLRYEDCYTWIDADDVAHEAADACQFLTKQL